MTQLAGELQGLSYSPAVRPRCSLWLSEALLLSLAFFPNIANMNVSSEASRRVVGEGQLYYLRTLNWGSLESA